jgi:hypothetical protein
VLIQLPSSRGRSAPPQNNSESNPGGSSEAASSHFNR